MGMIQSIVFSDLLRSGVVPKIQGCGAYLGAQKMGTTVQGTAIYAATFQDFIAGGKGIVAYEITNSGVFVKSLDGVNASQVYFDTNGRRYIMQTIKRLCCDKVTKRRRKRRFY